MQKQHYESLALQSQDIIIARETCKASGEDFAIYAKDRALLDKMSFKTSDEVFVIPNPTLCPDERQRRRLLQRNERNYFKSTCALTGKFITTNYNPKSGFTVYDTQVRWSDQRDALDYGRDRNLNESFFIQFHNLSKVVPKIAMMNDNGFGSINCEFTYDLSYSKNCYLTNETLNAESCFYGTDNIDAGFCVDCATVYDSQYCYECIDSRNLYACRYVENSDGCSNAWFLKYCRSCSFCFACTNLTNQQYCIWNKQYSKEDYDREIDQIISLFHTNPEEIIRKRNEFLATQIFPSYNIIGGLNTVGNNCFNCINCFRCFDMKENKDCRYFFLGAGGSNDCMDITISMPKSLCYEGVTPDESYKTCFSIFCWKCDNVRYSEMCHRCTNCFACVGLKDKEFCIFNKQYSKDEYEIQVGRIIRHMQTTGERGEFFPSGMSPHAYNLSDAMIRYPLTKEQALQGGYTRDDTEVSINIPANADLIQGQIMESHPEKVSETISNKVIICAESGRPYRIMKAELEIYRKLDVNLPRIHQDLRHKKRMGRRQVEKYNLVIY